MLKLVFVQNHRHAIGSALQDSRKLTGKCSEDIVGGVVAVKESKGNSE